jgi:CDP-diacylglycerol--glycerol-3-phosphate 3-phosphatidyltransferase
MSGVFALWPNRITGLRFAGALALFAMLALYGDDPATHSRRILVAFWLFIAVALTDILDGYLARRFHWESDFGRIADPFVDKVLVVGTMTFLSSLDWSREFMPAWIVVVVVAREFLITGIRGWAESKRQPLPADWFGKVKMGVQCVAIGFVIGIEAFDFEPDTLRRLETVTRILVWTTLASTVGSGASYVLKTRALFANHS